MKLTRPPRVAGAIGKIDGVVDVQDGIENTISGPATNFHVNPAVAARLGFEVVHYDLTTIDDLDNAFAAGLRDEVSAFYISGEPLLSASMSRVAN